MNTYSIGIFEGRLIVRRLRPDGSPSPYHSQVAPVSTTDEGDLANSIVCQAFDQELSVWMDCLVYYRGGSLVRCYTPADQFAWDAAVEDLGDGRQYRFKH